MNTHPTHTQVGGWGLWPMIVLGVGFFIVVVVVAYMCVCCCSVHVFLGVLLLLHVCVFVMWLCIVGFVCGWCEFLHFLSSLST